MKKSINKEEKFLNKGLKRMGLRIGKEIVVKKLTTKQRLDKIESHLKNSKNDIGTQYVHMFLQQQKVLNQIYEYFSYPWYKRVFMKVRMEKHTD